MSDTTISISDINAAFDNTTEPKDNKLIDLLKRAYMHEIECRYAIVSMELIRPFSDFKPELSETDKDEFFNKHNAGNPSELYVYQEKDAYVMSDDYLGYYLYRAFDATEALCLVLDPRSDSRIQYIDQPFKLSIPSVELKSK